MVTGTFSWLFYRFYEKKQYELMAVTILFMIYSVMESVAISVFFNYIPLIALTDEMSGKQGKSKNADWFSKNRKKLIASGTLLLCTVIGCLVVHPTEEVGRITPLINDEPNKIASAPLNEEEIQIQTFEATESFRGVRLYMATYHKYPILDLTATLQDGAGNIITTKKIKKLVVDNSYQTILFDETIEAGRYSLAISGKTKLGSAVIWQTEGNLYQAGAVIQNGIETDRDWIMTLVHDTVFRETGRVWTINRSDQTKEEVY